MSGQICTPERAQLHAAINSQITPAFGHVPLKETCEQIAAYEAPFRERIAELEAELKRYNPAELAALVEAAEAVVSEDGSPKAFARQALRTALTAFREGSAS